MGCLGNLLWFIFGGAISGLSWCLAGSVVLVGVLQVCCGAFPLWEYR